MDIGNNQYAFYLGIVTEYKGVKYNSMLPDSTAWGFSLIDDNTGERDFYGEATMWKVDKIADIDFSELLILDEAMNGLNKDGVNDMKNIYLSLNYKEKPF